MFFKKKNINKEDINKEDINKIKSELLNIGNNINELDSYIRNSKAFNVLMKYLQDYKNEIIHNIFINKNMISDNKDMISNMEKKLNKKIKKIENDIKAISLVLSKDSPEKNTKIQKKRKTISKKRKWVKFITPEPIKKG